MKTTENSQLLWILDNISLPKGLKWDFKNRPWQIDIIEDKAKQLVVKKPTQVGMSTVELCKLLWFAANHTCRAMFTLPRQDDLYDMVNGRLVDIIENSPKLQALFHGVDTVRMKQFGKSYVHFAEMSVTPRMLDVDYLVNDEVDMSEPDNLEQVVARLDASHYSYHHRISTPTLTDFGIDKLYQISDQKKWLVKCSYCLKEQPLTWDDNIIVKNGKAMMVCASCHNPIYTDDIENGNWVPTSSRYSEISGYHVTQLICPYIPIQRLYEQSSTMTAKNFRNLRLAEGYVPETGNISEALIRKKCFQSNHGEEDTYNDGRYLVGADQGNRLHIVVGKIVGDRLHIVHCETADFPHGFERLVQVCKIFKFKKGVLDTEPNRYTAYETSRKFGNRLVTAKFSGSVQSTYKESDVGIVINKTDLYDSTLNLIEQGRLQFPGKFAACSPSILDAVNSLSSMRRDSIKTKTQLGGEVTKHVWKSIGEDHYADAIAYLVAAYDMSVTKSGPLAVEIQSHSNVELDTEFSLIDEGDVLAPLNPYKRRVMFG